MLWAGFGLPTPDGPAVSQSRLIFWIILLSLPLIVLLGWFVTEQSPTWLSAVPGWLRPVSAAPFTGACEALASVNAYQGEFIRYATPTTLQAEDARSRAREIVQSGYDVLPPGEASLSPAVLVRGAFPGSGGALAWLVVAVLPKEADARFDRVAIVFVDAESGLVRALDTAVSVTDAAAACGGGPVSRRALVRQYLPLLLAAGYALLVACGVLVRGWWLRHRLQGGTTA